MNRMGTGFTLQRDERKVQAGREGFRRGHSGLEWGGRETGSRTGNLIVRKIRWIHQPEGVLTVRVCLD